jgi:hypothetical protein
LSHIKALQYALDHPEWKTVLIVEDDFTFHSDQTDEIIKAIDDLCHYAPFDACQLSYNPTGIFSDTNLPHIKKIVRAGTTSSYLITRSYIPTLLQNVIESSNDMQLRGTHHENCIDVHWNYLQLHGNWYCPSPAIGYQYDNYSDIAQCHTAYRC